MPYPIKLKLSHKSMLNRPLAPLQIDFAGILLNRHQTRRLSGLD
jgi:hypothetical protein